MVLTNVSQEMREFQAGGGVLIFYIAPFESTTQLAWAVDYLN